MSSDPHNSQNQNIQISNLIVDQRAERATVELATTLSQSSKVQLHIWFEGGLKQDLKGMI